MTKEKFYNNRKELVLKLWNLTRKKAAIAISKHNTILGLRNSITKEVSHLIDMKKENGLIVVNGNIKGYDAYAMNKGLPFEEPKQTFIVINSKRGIILHKPIFC